LQQEADSKSSSCFFNGSSSGVGSKVWNQFLQEADSKSSSCFFNGSSSRVGSPRSGTSFYRRLIPSPVHVFSMVLVQGLVSQGLEPVSTGG
jgi:hypothetical protein